MNRTRRGLPGCAIAKSVNLSRNVPPQTGFTMRELTPKLVLLTCALAASYTQAQQQRGAAPASAPVERHLANIRQLTHGGENAEAYFSRDGTHLIFQSTREGYACDQI